MKHWALFILVYLISGFALATEMEVAKGEGEQLGKSLWQSDLGGVTGGKLPGFANLDEITALSETTYEDKEVGYSGERWKGKTAKEIGAVNNEGGRSLNQALRDEGGRLTAMQEQVNKKASEGFDGAFDDSTAANPLSMITRNFVANKSAFDITHDDPAVRVALGLQPNQNSLDKVTCEEALHRLQDSCIENLKIDIGWEKSEIKANISGHHTNVGFFQIDLKNNKASVLNQSENVNVDWQGDPRKTMRSFAQAFNVTPLLGEVNSFSLSQQVPSDLNVDLTYKGISGWQNPPYKYGFEGVYYNNPVTLWLEETPSYENGYVAKIVTQTDANAGPGPHGDVWDGGGTRYRRPFSAELVWEFSKSKVTKEQWVGCAPTIKTAADRGCVLKSVECLQGQETRKINGVDVARPCWQQKRTFECLFASKNNCGQYRERGCQQTHSTCIKWVGNICANYQQTFVCKTGQQPTDLGELKGIYGLSNEVTGRNIIANNDLGESAKYLALAQSMAQSIKGDATNTHVFIGKPMQCQSWPTNCCDESGTFYKWSKSACTGDEQELVGNVKNRLCVPLGEYKLYDHPLGVKKHRKTNKGFCCFKSKLARIFQVGVRAQLISQYAELYWGSAESPNCQGLATSLLDKVDWSKIDMSELVEMAEVTAQSSLDEKLQDSMKDSVKKHFIKGQLSSLDNVQQKLEGPTHQSTLEAVERKKEEVYSQYTDGSQS